MTQISQRLSDVTLRSFGSRWAKITQKQPKTKPFHAQLKWFNWPKKWSQKTNRHRDRHRTNIEFRARLHNSPLRWQLWAAKKVNISHRNERFRILFFLDCLIPRPKGVTQLSKSRKPKAVFQTQFSKSNFPKAVRPKAIKPKADGPKVKSNIPTNIEMQ